MIKEKNSKMNYNSILIFFYIVGYNTFQFIWIESLAFFAGNIGLLSKFVRKYREMQAAILEGNKILRHQQRQEMQRNRQPEPVGNLDDLD